MFDSHAHLYHRKIKADIANIVQRFVEKGGEYIVNSAIDLATSCVVLDQAEKFAEVLPTIGIHPETFIPGADIYLANANGKWIKNSIEELNKMFTRFDDIVGVGECGLDYYWVKKEGILEHEKIFQLQKDALKAQIHLAKEYDLPLIVHCRDMPGDKQCEADILELIVKEGNSCVRGVFHSYTGSLSHLKDILALGFYVSFNGIVTYRSADNVRELLGHVDLDKILIESDSPLLSPQKKRSAGKKIGEPVFVDEVAEYVADLKDISKAELWKVVGNNFQKVFD
jgi:TatD DNase family protein